LICYFQRGEDQDLSPRVAAIAVVFFVCGIGSPAFRDKPVSAEKGASDSIEVAAAEPAQSATASDPVGEIPERKLRIDMTIHTWMSSVSSEVKTDEQESSSEVRFKDLLSAVDFANFFSKDWLDPMVGDRYRATMDGR